MATAREEAQHEDEEAIRVVLSTASGRRFVRMVLSFCEWNEDVFTADPTVLAARVGRHSTGVAIFKALEARQPELLAQVFAEDRERSELKRKRESNERSSE